MKLFLTPEPLYSSLPLTYFLRLCLPFYSSQLKIFYSGRPSHLFFIIEPVYFTHSPNYNLKWQTLDFKLHKEWICSVLHPNVYPAGSQMLVHTCIVLNKSKKMNEWLAWEIILKQKLCVCVCVCVCGYSQGNAPKPLGIVLTLEMWTQRNLKH